MDDLIVKFFNKENLYADLLQQIKVDSFKVNLAFLTEITSLLTSFNLKLQRQGQNIA